MDVVVFQFGQRQITVARKDEPALVEWAKKEGVELLRGSIPDGEGDRCVNLPNLTKLLNGRQLRIRSTNFTEGPWRSLPQENFRLRRGDRSIPQDLLRRGRRPRMEVEDYIRGQFSRNHYCELFYLVRRFGGSSGYATTTLRQYARRVGREFCATGDEVECRGGVYRIVRPSI